MKFIHISDLHIGKRIHEFSMLDDQKYILDEISGIIEEEQADGVLIAGDIYDKTVPSAESVQIFDNFLTRLSKGGYPVFMISGNHDSPERLSFGAELFEDSGIYISQVYKGQVKRITMKDKFGLLNVYLLPFLKPSIVRHALEAEEINTYQEAVEAALRNIKIDTSERNVLVAHQFVTGAGRSDSEEISVGGIDQVNGDIFELFDYTALGHIHGPQYVGKESVRYCGTPLKYSFSEASHKKTVTVVELLEKGRVEIKMVPLVPKHDMRKLKGTYMEVTDRSTYTDENRYDYLQITLTDEEDIPNGMARLRTVYPNLMRLEYDNKRTRENREIKTLDEKKQKTEMELFEEFYKLLNNESMNEEQRIFMKDFIQELKEEKR